MLLAQSCVCSSLSIESSVKYCFAMGGSAAPLLWNFLELSDPAAVVEKLTAPPALRGAVIVALEGRHGSGKSTIAQILCRELVRQNISAEVRRSTDLIGGLLLNELHNAPLELQGHLWNILNYLSLRIASTSSVVIFDRFAASSASLIPFAALEPLPVDVLMFDILASDQVLAARNLTSVQTSANQRRDAYVDGKAKAMGATDFPNDVLDDQAVSSVMVPKIKAAVAVKRQQLRPEPNALEEQFHDREIELVDLNDEAAFRRRCRRCCCRKSVRFSTFREGFHCCVGNYLVLCVIVVSLIASLIGGVLAGLWALITVPAVGVGVWIFIFLASHDYKITDLVVISSEQVLEIQRYYWYTACRKQVERIEFRHILRVFIRVTKRRVMRRHRNGVQFFSHFHNSSSVVIELKSGERLELPIVINVGQSRAGERERRLIRRFRLEIEAFHSHRHHQHFPPTDEGDEGASGSQSCEEVVQEGQDLEMVEVDGQDYDGGCSGGSFGGS